MILGLLATTLLGIYSLRLLTNRNWGILAFFLGAALGLGINGAIVFFARLVLGCVIPWVPVAISCLFLGVGLWLNRRTLKLKHIFEWQGFALLALIGIFIYLEAGHYPLGGWDAWSCWNLKAKFIYLGQERWKDIFDPILWRSNTQYPLLLPCINVWFWDLTGGHPGGPLFLAGAFYILTAGLLLFGLRHFGTHWLPALILTAATFLLPFNITLGASQYSDILVGLYLLCAFICLWADEPVLMGVFLGFLSFTKTEGMVAALILAGLMMWRYRTNCVWLRRFGAALTVAGIPTLWFTLFMAPPNEAFINGLTSAKKPSDLGRLTTILTFLYKEVINFKWNGLLLLWLAGIVAFRNTVLEGKVKTFVAFFVSFFVVLLAYYQINTFFEISWWLDNTLSRVIFALLPSMGLWLGLSVTKGV